METKCGKEGLTVVPLMVRPDHLKCNKWSGGTTCGSHNWSRRTDCGRTVLSMTHPLPCTGSAFCVHHPMPNRDILGGRARSDSYPRVCNLRASDYYFDFIQETVCYCVFVLCTVRMFLFIYLALQHGYEHDTI